MLINGKLAKYIVIHLHNKLVSMATKKKKRKRKRAMSSDPEGVLHSTEKSKMQENVHDMMPS